MSIIPKIPCFVLPSVFTSVVPGVLHGPTLNDALVLFCISLAGTLFASLTAGGSAMITLPLLLAVGIPAPTAIAIQKLNGVFFSLIAGYNYGRGAPRNWRFIAIFGLLGMGGAYIGLNFLLSIDESLIRRLFGGILLGVILVYYLQPQLGIQSAPAPAKPPGILDHLAAIPFGIYEGFLGSGNALIFSLFVVRRLGFDLLGAMAHYYTVAAGWVMLILAMLYLRGHFEWLLMSPALCGSLLGAWLGTRFVAARGNKFLRNMLMIAGGLLALRLFWFAG